MHALRVFEAVARLSNFTNAAHELHLTQSAVSHQIRNLEEFFGTPLIIRDKRLLSLTPEGTELYIATQQALNVVSEATGRIMARRNQVRIKALLQAQGSAQPLSFSGPAYDGLKLHVIGYGISAKLIAGCQFIWWHLKVLRPAIATGFL